MTHSHRVLLALLFGILSIPPALGQTPATTTAPASLPAAVKSAAVIDPGVDAQIKKFVADQVTAIGGLNAEAVSKARDALIAEAKGGTPAYQAKYAEALNTEILNLLQNLKDMRARLNAAIVVARVADEVKNTKLEKAVLLLLAPDRPEALKLWGMRAAKSLLPELVKVGGEKPLADAILATVKQLPTNGNVTQDAYEALNPRNVPPKSVPAVVEPLLELVAWRLKIYKDGLPGAKVLVPDEPLSDAVPFNNILTPDVWKHVDKAKKQDVKAMQLACELLALSAMRGDDALYQNQREQLKDSIVRVSAALYVAASVMNEQKVVDAAKQLNQVAQGSAVNLIAAVTPLCELIPQMKGFDQVRPPPMPHGPPPAQSAPAGEPPPR